MVDNTLSAVNPALPVKRKSKQDEMSPAGLGRDGLALLTIFLMVVTHHIQSPLLQFEVQFGRAFRNVTLQPVLAAALVLCAGILIWTTGAWRSLSGRIAAAGLSLFALHVVLAIVFDFNLFGAVVGLPQELLLTELADDAPRQLFEMALLLSTVLELVGLVCVVWLWSPWGRLPVYGQAVQHNAPGLMVAVIVLILWEGLIVLFQIQEFFLPRPSTIATTFIEIYPRLVTVGWNTFQNAVWGFIVGCGLGFLTGMISARFASLSKALLPLAIAANSVPIIAFAPIVNFWFGALNPASKVAIVAILTYFPAMISTVRGLTSASALQVELMRSYAASELQTFRKLRLPAALPFVFSALKVSTTLSMIGAIVSEYFGGTTQGLGYRIREDANNFKYPEAWAAIIIAALLGILFYALVSAVERGIMPWHVSFRDE